MTTQPRVSRFSADEPVSAFNIDVTARLTGASRRIGLGDGTLSEG